jgi:hypothetical protein
MRKKHEASLAGKRRGQEAAAVDSAGTALGALGMLAFAVALRLMVENSALGAFIVGSLAWLVISVAAWYVRRKMRYARRGRTGRGSAIPRSHQG